MTINDQILSQLSEVEAKRRQAALKFDVEDKLGHLRSQFIFPTKRDLKSKTILDRHNRDTSQEEPCLYLCGNSLGLQPKLVSARVAEHLSSWAQRGVTGHFVQPEDATLSNWVDADDVPAKVLADIVGAQPEEIAAMETLTANLHILMASFYRPTKEKYKIIMEGKAFPSDHYALESQLRQHGFTPRTDLITIFPEAPAQILTTEQIMATIDEHASTTALVLLPGIQYYTGQLLDIPRITAHAHSHGLIIGWDLAHAAGNVPLQLHDWDVDFAVWCHYKYINAGPGAIGGLFVHSRHGQVDSAALASGDLEHAYRHRLAGWWGHDKSARFRMNTVPDGDSATAFVPRPGAGGFQLGNTCVIALAALQGSLDVFATTDMQSLRAKSIAMTAFLEEAIDYHAEHFWEGLSVPEATAAVAWEAENEDAYERTNGAAENGAGTAGEPPAKKAKKSSPPYWIITPRDPHARGAQLSVQLSEGMLLKVMDGLEEHGVVIDERKPDVVRVAPAPLYNSFEDCWRFAYVFNEICRGVLDPKYTPRLAPSQ